MGFLFKLVQRIIVPIMVFAAARSLLSDILRGWAPRKAFRDGERENSDGRTKGGASGTRYRQSPYAVLGLPPTASDEEVRARYRRLIAKYHPDKFAQLNDQEFSELAAEKFQRIQSAYDEIRRRRGL